MTTRILHTSGIAPDADIVREAGRALAQGSLVIFPTETVYGVGANLLSREATESLSRLKDRTPDKPFTLHLADPSDAARYAGPLSPLARRLILKTWPGPLTLVVPDRRETRGEPAGLVEEALYYQGCIGLRCPDHEVGRAILREAGVPVAGSSANLAGRPAPRTLAEALADLVDKVPLAVDGGPTPYARASTVVRIREDDTFEVLREGAITARRVERLARTRLMFICTGNLCRSPMAAGLAARKLAGHFGCEPEELPERGIDVASAGTGTGPGYQASPRAIEAMAERGIDIRDHHSQPITVDALLASDYIWCMTREHMDAVLTTAPEVAGRVAVLDPSGRSVADPMGGDLDAYRSCARQMEEAITQRLREVVG